jgi:hypothetical protein
MNAGVLSPQQDILHIQQPFVRPLAQRKWILPIDPARLKNHGKMFDLFKSPEWAMWDGKLVALPYYWGYDSIVYNAKHMPDGGETWGRLWDDRYRGRLSSRLQPQSTHQGAAGRLQEVPHLEEAAFPSALVDLRRGGESAQERGGVGTVGMAAHGHHPAQGRDGRALRTAEGARHRVVRLLRTPPRSRRATRSWTG